MWDPVGNIFFFFFFLVQLQPMSLPTSCHNQNPEIMDFVSLGGGGRKKKRFGRPLFSCHFCCCIHYLTATVVTQARCQGNHKLSGWERWHWYSAEISAQRRQLSGVLSLPFQSRLHVPLWEMYNISQKLFGRKSDYKPRTMKWVNWGGIFGHLKCSSSEYTGVATSVLWSAVCMPLKCAGMVPSVVSHMELIKQSLEVNY